MSDLQRARDRAANLRRRTDRGEDVDPSQLAEAESLVRLLEGSKTGDAFEEAQRIRRRLSEQVEKIRQDPHLSDQGRKAKIARLWKDAEGEVAVLRKTHQANVAAAESELRRQAFGPPSDVDHAEYRGALAFADQQATSRERAAAAMNRAAMTGDTLLARAVATVAVERGFTNVVDQYRAEFDDRGEVAALDAHRSRHGTPTAKFARVLHLNVPKPSELEGMGLNHVERLIAEQDGPT